MVCFINWQDIGDAIVQAVRTFCGFIAGYIYDFIVILYDLFIRISTAEFLDNAFVRAIYRKVGLLLGLFMIFKLSLTLIQSLVNPDKLTDKKSGFLNVIVRCVFCIVLLGVTPTIFKEAFSLQRLLIGANNNENVLYKIIVGKGTINSDNFGVTLAADVFFSFYTDNEDPFYSGGSVLHDNQTYEETNFDTIESQIRGTNLSDNERKSFTYASQFLAAVGGEKSGYMGKYLIEYNFIFSIIVGCFIVWILSVYCIQSAIRVIQLGYLQLIAPIPIFSYIVDPEGAFKRWIKQCTTTYLDLFIRLSIIYFVVYLVTDLLYQIGDPSSILRESVNLTDGDTLLIWVKIFLIVGLLLFAKKVPELLKELFPNLFAGGAAKFSFGLKPPKEFTSFTKGAATLASGAVIGGVAGMASGIRHGEGWRKLIAAPGGFVRGALSARTKGNIFANAKKGMANVRTVNDRAYKRHHDGSDIGRLAPVYAERLAKRDERELQSYTDYNNLIKAIETEAEKDSNVQLANESLNSVLQRGFAKKTLTFTDSSGMHITYNVGQRISSIHMADAIKAAHDMVDQAKLDFVANEINKERTRGDGNQVVISAAIGMEKLREDGVSQGYQGFETDTMSLSSGASDSVIADRLLKKNKKSTKKETTSMTSRGGARYEETQRHKANASYKNKNK